MKIVKFQTDIVLVDIIGYSKLTDDHQFLAVQVLDAVIKTELKILTSGSIFQNFKYIIGFVATGDGFYCILHPGVCGYGVFFALALRTMLIRRFQKCAGVFGGVRVAAYFGTAMPFRSVTGLINFVGTGLNNCSRLLMLKDEELRQAEEFAGDKNIVLASDGEFNQFQQIFPSTNTRVTEFLSVVKFRHSEEQTTRDKHGMAHTYRSVDSSRHVSISPPAMMRLSDQQMREVDEALASI